MAPPGAASPQVAVPLVALDSHSPRDPRHRARAARGVAVAFSVLAVAGAYAAAGTQLVRDHALLIALAGCASLLLAASFAAYRCALANAAARERRRIARDLHDGLAQELAYVRMETHRLMARSSDPRVARIAAAAERALAESREVVAGLYRDNRPLPAQLRDVAHELTERAGARLTFEGEPSVEVDPEHRQALVRILREAITNGLRHGHATEVALQLSGGEGVRMSVHDNGTGFVPGGARRRGSFGLTTMRERAQALGGDLTVRSNPGEGTVVEVILP